NNNDNNNNKNINDDTVPLLKFSSQNGYLSNQPKNTEKTDVKIDSSIQTQTQISKQMMQMQRIEDWKAAIEKRRRKGKGRKSANSRDDEKTLETDEKNKIKNKNKNKNKNKDKNKNKNKNKSNEWGEHEHENSNTSEEGKKVSATMAGGTSSIAHRLEMVCACVGGIPTEFAWSLGESIIVPYLLSLGSPYWMISFVFILSPPFDSWLQPLYGQWSDQLTRTRNACCKLGGRKPFMLLFGSTATIGFFLTPFTRQLVDAMFHIAFRHSPSTDAFQYICVCVAIFGYTLVDMSHGLLLIPSKAIVNDIAENESDIDFGTTCYSIFQCLGRIVGYSIVIIDWKHVFSNLGVNDFAFMFCIASIPLWISIAFVVLGTPNQSERLLEDTLAGPDTGDASHVFQSPLSLDFVPNLPSENTFFPTENNDNKNKHKKSEPLQEKKFFASSNPKRTFPPVIITITADYHPPLLPTAVSNSTTTFSTAVTPAAAIITPNTHVTTNPNSNVNSNSNTTTAAANANANANVNANANASANVNSSGYPNLKRQSQYLLKEMPLMMYRGRGDAFQYRRVVDEADDMTTATELSDTTINNMRTKTKILPSFVLFCFVLLCFALLCFDFKKKKKKN
ncbi:hypothetical protein RFI_09086, partial [Reticulomyxa filosa]